MRQIRRRIQNRFNTRMAILGDETGAVDVPNTLDKVYVRYPEGVDASGNTVYSPAQIVNAGVFSSYVFAPGVSVRVGMDDYGERAVLRADSRALVQAGISPRVVNRLRPDTNFVSLSQMSLFMSRPVGAASEPSSLITVYPLVYDIDGMIVHYRGTEAVADKLNMATFAPATGQKVLVCVFLDTFLRRAVAYASNPIPEGQAFTMTQYEQCFALRSTDDVPSGSFEVFADAVVNSRNIALDLRQWINMPPLLGDVDVIRQRTRVWPNRVLTRDEDLRLDATLAINGRVRLLGSF